MEREDFTSWIYFFFDQALEYLMGMVQIQSEFTRLRLFVCQWEEIMGESVGRAVEESRVMMSRAQAKFDELEVLVACVMALAEITYLHVDTGGLGSVQGEIGGLLIFLVMTVTLGLGRTTPICISLFFI
jgi:hypothetical protein